MRALVPTSAGAVMMVVYKVLSTLDRDWVDAVDGLHVAPIQGSAGCVRQRGSVREVHQAFNGDDQQEVHAVGDGQQLSVYSRQSKEETC